MTVRSPQFRRVVIVGVGLLGASLGMALRRRGLVAHGGVVGVGRKGSPSLAIARKKGAIEEASTDLAAAARGADLVVLATPVRRFPKVLRTLARVLPAGAVVTDVGSTKVEVMRWGGEILPREVAFVGSHPMAGSEKRGPATARADLFDGALCLMCAGKGAGAAEKRVERMWQALGMRTCWVKPQVHDRWVAVVSHLPHAAAACLLTTAARSPAALAAAATGFADTTRVAAGDAEMWTDILLTNRREVAAALGRYIKELEALRKAILAGDEAKVRRLLVRARDTRMGMVVGA